MSERKMIYLCLAHLSEDRIEQKYVQEAFDTNWVVPMGPNVTAFEEDLRKFVTGNVESAVYQGSRWPEATAAAWNLNPALKDTKVVCLSAGTAAVHLALLACGVGPGDEVCVQSFTFCASSHPITYLGATPVFIDSEPETWNMDPQLLEQAILDRKEKTGKYPKAIVPVALCRGCSRRYGLTLQWSGARHLWSFRCPLLQWQQDDHYLRRWSTHLSECRGCSDHHVVRYPGT